jgi:hypothetical protein
MSIFALWFIVDSCKFIYNIIYKTPIQMIASGGLQIFLDFFSLMQIICYRDNNPHYKSTDETNITIPNFTNTKNKKVQQINQFMNKLEERFSEEVESNKNSNRDENEKHLDKNDSKKVFNTIIVPEKIENSDKIEVLDKSQHDKIENHSDDEEEKNENNLKPEKEQNLNDEKNDIKYEKIKTASNLCFNVNLFDNDKKIKNNNVKKKSTILDMSTLKKMIRKNNISTNQLI